MSDKFRNKYRISSHRRPNWDYSVEALYFLTIVTQNRVCNLGSIENDKTVLSDFGKIVEEEWYESFKIRKELHLHEFIIMPNHLHAIVEIFHDVSAMAIVDEKANDDENKEIPNNVETHGRVSLHKPDEEFTPTNKNNYSDIKRNAPVRLPQSISSFLAGFKAAVNTKIDDYIDEHNLPIPKYNKQNHFFQPNYHDHIIRNSNEFETIKYYIINNPLNWGTDSLNS